jgi:AraC-like DNA-binding protein
MHYREHAPPAELKDMVECVWELRTGSEPTEVQRIVPDGSVELIVHRSTPFSRVHNGKAERQPHGFVVGQSTAPFLVASAPGAHTFGLRIRGEAARAVTGVPANLLTNEAIPMDAISTTWQAFAKMMIECGPSGPVFRSLQGMTRRMKPPREVTAAVTILRQSNGIISMDRLAGLCNVSPRKLQRLFREHVGLPPKVLSRIFRFQHVFKVAPCSSPREWAQVALKCGYVDQAHLIRDFREFAGQPPAALLSAESDLAEMFLRARRMSDFSNRPH